MTGWAPSPAQCAAEAVQLVSVTLCNTDGVLVLVWYLLMVALRILLNFFFFSCKHHLKIDRGSKSQNLHSLKKKKIKKKKGWGEEGREGVLQDSGGVLRLRLRSTEPSSVSFQVQAAFFLSCSLWSASWCSYSFYMQKG